MGLLTVADAATGALLRERIAGRNTPKTNIPGLNRRLAARTIENIIPCSKVYFFLNVKCGRRFFSPLRQC